MRGFVLYQPKLLIIGGVLDVKLIVPRMIGLNVDVYMEDKP